MKKEKNGYITVYLTLTLGVMLSLVFVLLEAVRNETIRTEIEGVMDIGLFSVFGEFNRQLLEQYDLFFIDTSYGEGRPDIKRTEEHLQYYMNENFYKETIGGWLGFRDLTALSCDNVELECYMYASDKQGEVLKYQIVDYMQDKIGIDTAEKILPEFGVLKDGNYMSMDFSKQWDMADEKLNNLVEEKRQEMIDPETGEEIPIGLDNPANYVKAVKAQGILGLALPPEKELSSVVIHPEYYFSQRIPSQGQGTLNIQESLIDKATESYLLTEYLMEKCSSYSSGIEKAVLKYQIEYLLAGQAGDLENLEEVVEDILHIREGVNFTYLISDEKKTAEADALAWAVSALLFSPEIKEAVKATILFAWSYAESVKDIRILLDGNKLPLLKSSDTWNTPLSQLLMFTSCLDQYEVSAEGMVYEDYLRLFLSLKSEKEILYRFMDICEMDIRVTEGNEYFQMDGCISAVKAKANVSSDYGNGYEITRTYTYK